jgi:hypothetical protein
MANGVYGFGVAYAVWVVPLAPVQIAHCVEAGFNAAFVFNVDHALAAVRPFARVVTG